MSQRQDVTSHPGSSSDSYTYKNGATLALVYGRRRQGKTLLLELMTESTGGFLATGLEQSSAMNLASIGSAYAAHAGLGAPVSFGSWEHAVDALLAFGEREAPTPVVLDEFPCLAATAPQLPSIIQRALSPRGRARRRSRARFVLCGSAFSMMRNLLSGTAALRGRAPREVVLHPFGPSTWNASTSVTDHGRVGAGSRAG